MIFAYMLFLVLGIAAFLLLGRLEMPARLVLALGIFLLPAIALTAWVSYVGDEASSDSAIVSPQPPEE